MRLVVTDNWTIYPVIGFVFLAVVWWLDRSQESKRRRAKDRRFILWGIVAAGAIAWNIASRHWSPIDGKVTYTTPTVAGALGAAKLSRH